MRNPAFYVLCLLSLPIFANATAIIDVPCNLDGYDQLYRADAKDGFLLYWEDEQSAGSSHSDARFERRDTSGNLIWRADAYRGCSQGIPHCYLTLPFNLDGKPAASIESQINYFEIEGKDYVLFSHLKSKIVQAYFKSYVSQEFSLPDASGMVHSRLDERQYEIPNLFKPTCN